MPNTYSPLCFSALPSLGDAGQLFSDSGARNYLEGPIRKLFLDFQVESRYGVALLHRHFNIGPTNRLVEYNNTATAWDAPDDTTDGYEQYEGHVVPRSYLFDEDGSPRPYEFAFVYDNNTSPISEDTGFVSEFHSLLSQHGLEKVFGLRTLEGHDPGLSIEVTEGSANIMLPPTSIAPDSLIEAMWIFSAGDDSTKRCHCRTLCRKIGDRHLQEHTSG